MNWTLLVVFALILAAVVASNVWLRRRAEAERKAENEDPAR